MDEALTESDFEGENFDFGSSSGLDIGFGSGCGYVCSSDSSFSSGDGYLSGYDPGSSCGYGLGFDNYSYTTTDDDSNIVLEIEVDLTL